MKKSIDKIIKSAAKPLLCSALALLLNNSKINSQINFNLKCNPFVEYGVNRYTGSTSPYYSDLNTIRCENEFLNAGIELTPSVNLRNRINIEDVGIPIILSTKNIRRYSCLKIENRNSELLREIFIERKTPQFGMEFSVKLSEENYMKKRKWHFSEYLIEKFLIKTKFMISKYRLISEDYDNSKKEKKIIQEGWAKRIDIGLSRTLEYQNKPLFEIYTGGYFEFTEKNYSERGFCFSLGVNLK